jgi:hypothetical protein
VIKADLLTAFDHFFAVSRSKEQENTEQANYCENSASFKLCFSFISASSALILPKQKGVYLHLFKPILEEKRIMNTETQYNLEAVKLSMLSRITRIALGTLLLAIPMTHSGVLGALTVLPLVAVYPILTGLLGYGFVELLAVNRRRLQRPARLLKAARASLVALGIGLIAIVMVSETAPVWLALLGIFPMLMGLLDSDLLGEAVVTRRALQHTHTGAAAFAQTHTLHKPTRVSDGKDFDTKQAA